MAPRQGEGESPHALELWLVDDTPAHHDTVRATIAHMPQVRFTAFDDANEAVNAYERLARASPRTLPAVVLMDFYLGSTNGDAVTRALRLLQPPGTDLIIVGYSSVAAASRAIVEAGGDAVVRKSRADGAPNADLARYLAGLVNRRAR